MVTPDESSERWVRFWVKSVRENSTARKLKRGDRCLFYEYIALARWQPDPPRLRGCLCDEDGRGWTRPERAEVVGESYSVVKRAEEAMEELGLITFHEAAASHHSSKGRLRIVKYDRYQGGLNDEETAFKSEGKPSNPKAVAFQSEGCNAKQPSNLKADSSGETAFNSEGMEAERSTGATDATDATSEKTAFGFEGSDPVEVNDVENNKKEEEEEGTSTSEVIEEARQVLCVMLQQDGGSPAIDAALMAATRVHKRAYEVLVQECGAIAARQAQGEKVDLQYLPSNVRDAVERLEERDALHDDTDRLFIRLVGPKPRDGSLLKKQEWEEELRDFRKDRELYLWQKCGSGGWDRVKERANEMGLWDDGLPDRVIDRIRSGDYDEEPQT